MVCEKCSNELNEGLKFCTKCGSKVKVKLDKKLFIPSVILMSVGILGILGMIGIIRIGQIINIPPHPLPFLHNLFRPSFVDGGGILWNLQPRGSWGGYSNLFIQLTFFSGITLAFISLYKKRHKATMIVVISACALYLLIGLLSWIEWHMMSRRWHEGQSQLLYVYFGIFFDFINARMPRFHGGIMQSINILNILDFILYGTKIGAFILLYNKKQKIILIAGLAVIALSFVLNLVYLFRNLWMVTDF